MYGSLDKFFSTPDLWPINKKYNFDIEQVLWTPASLTVAASNNLFDDVMDGIMGALPNRELFGVHGVLPGEVQQTSDFVDLSVSLFSEDNELEGVLQPPPTKTARVDEQDVKPFILPFCDDKAASSHSSVLSGTVRGPHGTVRGSHGDLRNGFPLNGYPKKSPKKDDRVRIVKDRRETAEMIYVRRNLSSWSDRESLSVSSCLQCKEAARWMHVCSLVASKDVLPLLESVVQYYIEFGYDKGTVVSAVKEGFKKGEKFLATEASKNAKKQQ